MILQETDEGLLLRVRISPKASADRIGPVQQDNLKIAITAAPEKGKANSHLVKLLAKKLHLAKKDIVIVAGEKDRKKTLLLRGVGAKEVKEKLFA